MADLEELKRAAEAATPGPWVVWSSLYEHMDAQLRSADGTVEGVALAEFYSLSNGFKNAEFARLAHPATILDLISRLEEAEKALEDIRDTLLDIADRLEEEGDRTFLGSTNDGDEIKTIAQNLDARRWADVRRAHAAHKRLRGDGE